MSYIFQFRPSKLTLQAREELLGVRVLVMKQRQLAREAGEAAAAEAEEESPDSKERARKFASTQVLAQRMTVVGNKSRGS